MSDPREMHVENTTHGSGASADLQGASHRFFLDATTTRSLQALVEGVSTLTGFGEVGVVGVSADGRLQEVVRITPTASAACFDPPTSLLEWGDQLDGADGMGGLFFVGGERAGHDQHWAERSWLATHLLDEQHRFSGFMWVGQPHDGRTPSTRTCVLLESTARHVGQVLAVGVERRDADEQSRLLATSRTVVRGAGRELDINAVLTHAYKPLVAGLRAEGLWLHLFGSHEGEQSTLHTENAELTRLTPEQERLAMRIAQDAWRQQRVGAVSHSRLRGGLLSASEVEGVRMFLTENRVGSLLFVPIGVDSECLGSLIVARTLQDALWSEPEIDMALDLGHDLGQALANAMSYQRERELVERLRATDAHKTTLIRTMSHEMKSPLTAILANLEMLEDNVEGTPEARYGLAGVDRGARRLLRVVDDLLVLAENGDPEAPLSAGQVDLAQLAADAAALKRTEAMRDGVSIDVRRGPGSHLVTGSASTLDLVVTNLLSNAVKYSPGGGRVTLCVEQVAADVVLTCADEGIGIAAEEVGSIFGEFFRSSNTAARAQPGTGLGLAIVERIVDRHGGTVDVASELGRGTSFAVRLPAATALPTEPAELAETGVGVVRRPALTGTPDTTALRSYKGPQPATRP